MENIIILIKYGKFSCFCGIIKGRLNFDRGGISVNLEYPYNYQNVEDMASKYLPEEQIKIIKESYELAKDAHQGNHIYYTQFKLQEF